MRLVRRLLTAQLPHRSGLPLTPIEAWGTDHAIFRLGDDLSVRVPKIAWAAQQGVLEARWLPVLAPNLPVEVPVPLAVGEPADAYPFRWYVSPWLSGANPRQGGSGLLAVWDAGLHAPDWDEAAVWVHGDLMDGNLLVRDGRLSGVIDWGGLVAGDPAVELMVAWSFFDADSREVYRGALRFVDDASERCVGVLAIV